MTYDQLYEHITKYVAQPNTDVTEHNKLCACLILGVFMEFILDCNDDGVDANTIDMIDFIHEKIDIIEESK